MEGFSVMQVTKHKFQHREFLNGFQILVPARLILAPIFNNEDSVAQT